MENNIRYDIVFLRCLAVVAVVCFHFKLLLFRDGYAGVDVFFVLSGFLMTQIITTQIQDGTFSLMDFYFRRLARVLPALLFVVLIFLLLLYALLGIKLYDFSRYALSSTLFVSNIYYYKSAGYFLPSSQLNFMLHTWSLSVEMQFYITYPLLMFGLGAWLKRRSYVPVAVLVLVLILSFACMYGYAQVEQSFAFYMFPTRTWELLAGALAFFCGPAVVRCIPTWVRTALSTICVLLLIVSLSGYFQIGAKGWPSTFTMLPVGLSSFVLLMAPDNRLFRSAVVVYLARISYSWYLWHWPIVVLCTYFAWGQDIQSRCFFFVLSIVISGVAYYLVEQRQRFRQPSVLIAGILLMVALTFSLTQVSLAKILSAGNEPALGQFQRSYPVNQAPAQYDFDKGHLLANSPFEKFDRSSLFRFSDSSANYLLLGDCHAGMFSATLRELAAENKVNLLQATADETFPVPGIKSAYRGPSELMNYMYNSYLPANLHKIDKVILAANYVSYSKRELSTYVNQLDSFFSAYNIPIILIGQTEGYRVEYPVVEVLHRRFGINRSDYLLSARHHANQFLKRSKLSSRYIDVYNLPNINRGDGNQAYFYDADHLSTFGTKQYAALLQDRIFGDNPNP